MKHAFSLAAAAGLLTAFALGAPAAAAQDKDFVFIDKDIRIHKLRDFKDIDANQDGKVSREEYLADPAADFDELDSNKDGFIDSDEREAVFDRKIGRIHDVERERWEGLLERFDADGDEMLALDEILDKTDEKVAEAMKRLGDHDRTWEHHFEAPLMFGGLLDWHLGRGPAIVVRNHMLEELDGNGDGEVTEQEFVDARKDHFKALDRDGDGKLSQDELEEFAWGGAFAFQHRDEEDEDGD